MSAFDPPRVVECRFAGSSDQVADARCWARAWLDKFGVPDNVAEDAVLVLSELATNSVLHSRSGGSRNSYLVRLRRGAGALCVEVVDNGARTEPRAQRSNHPCNGDPHPFTESGRGLLLVEHLATRWWTRGDENCRTVAAEIALDAAV